MNWGLSRSWAAVLETLGARRQPARGSWSSSVTEGQKHINHRKWAPRIFQKPLKYYIFHSIFIRVTLNNNNNKITYLILYEGLALQQSILNHCSWLQHPLSDCWLKSWPLRFWFSFLLTNLGRQQEAAQVPGPLAPMAETQMNPVFLASAWLSSGCLTTWGVSERMKIFFHHFAFFKSTNLKCMLYWRVYCAVTKLFQLWGPGTAFFVGCLFNIYLVWR